MSSQHARTRLGSARALLAVVLLAGVFAMHGLTGNHDVTMAMTHPAPVASVSGQLDSGAAHPTAPAHPEHVTPATEHMAPATEHVAPATEHVAPATEHLAPAMEHVAPGTEHVAPGTGRVAAGAEHVVPATGGLGIAQVGATPPSVSSGEPRSLPELSAQGDRHGHVHSMGDVCLAMLAALLLALIGALARRSLTLAHPVQLMGAAVPVPFDGALALWSRPNLLKLCVLRT